MRCLAACVTATLFLPTLGPAASDGAVSLEEYLLRLQSSGPRSIVTYCIEEVPDLRNELAGEYERFSANIRLAAEPMLSRLGEKRAAPVPASLTGFEEIGAKMLEVAKQFPAQNYCRWLLGSMQKASVETLRHKIEAEYARYEALADQSRAKASK